MGLSVIYEYELASFYKELVEEYLKNKNEEFEKLERAMNESDFTTIKIIGHNLAGTGGSYGLTSLTDIGDRMESSAEESNLEECKNQINEYRQFLDTVKVSYK